MSWLRDCETDDGSRETPPEPTRVLLAEVVAEFFNKLLDSGDVPVALTKSKVIALLKPTKDKSVPDATAFASYRLLSLRNLLDKVVQLIITRRLSHFMNLSSRFTPLDASPLKTHLYTLSLWTSEERTMKFTIKASCTSFEKWVSHTTLSA